MAKTGIKQMTSAVRKVEKAILEFEGGEFTASQIAEKTGLEITSVRNVLYKKTANGSVEIVSSETVYRHNGRKIAQNLPAAFLAEKIWTALTSADRPLTVRELAAAAETLAGDKNLNLLHSTHGLMSRWFYGSDALERTGEGYKNDPYKYQPRVGITARPVSTCRGR